MICSIHFRTSTKKGCLMSYSKMMIVILLYMKSPVESTVLLFLLLGDWIGILHLRSFVSVLRYISVGGSRDLTDAIIAYVRYLRLPYRSSPYIGTGVVEISLNFTRQVVSYCVSSCIRLLTKFISFPAYTFLAIFGVSGFAGNSLLDVFVEPA